MKKLFTIILLLMAAITIHAQGMMTGKMYYCKDGCQQKVFDYIVNVMKQQGCKVWKEEDDAVVFYDTLHYIPDITTFRPLLEGRIPYCYIVCFNKENVNTGGSQYEFFPVNQERGLKLGEITDRYMSEELYNKYPTDERMDYKLYKMTLMQVRAFIEAQWAILNAKLTLGLRPFIIE